MLLMEGSFPVKNLRDLIIRVIALIVIETAFLVKIFVSNSIDCSFIPGALAGIEIVLLVKALLQINARGK